MNCKGRGKTRRGTVSWYLNNGSPEYEARVLPTGQRSSVSARCKGKWKFLLFLLRAFSIGSG